MKIVKVTAEMKLGEAIMLPEGKAFEVTRADGSVELYNGIQTNNPTGRYILEYDNGHTEVVSKQRGEQEQAALLQSWINQSGPLPVAG